MSTGLVDVIKRASLDAVESQKPCDLRFGTVISASPLKIRVTEQFVLPESTLIVPEHLTKHETKITITDEYGWKTEEEKTCETTETHRHKILSTEQKVLIHNELKVGDKVVLIRMQGGQFYYVAGRIK